MTPTTASAGQSYMPTSATWFSVQWNGLRSDSGCTSRPFTDQSTAKAMPAMPAAPARPSNGARANASPPKNSAMNPSHSAKPMADSGEIGSPRAASPYVFELTTSITAMNASASVTVVRCAASFSRAIRRLPNGVAATMSRLPLPASPASVDDSPRIDQIASASANVRPYFQVT
jgi:hypothetical protein